MNLPHPPSPSAHSTQSQVVRKSIFLGPAKKSRWKNPVISGGKELLTPPAIKILLYPIVHECEYVCAFQEVQREKLIKPPHLCQGIKCSLGPGFEAKKCTSTGLLVLIQFIVERGNEVKSGAGHWNRPCPLLSSLGRWPQSWEGMIAKCASVICRALAHGEVERNT